jgi:hypothetical protein
VRQEITMKQLGLSIASAALLILSAGCEAEGADQDYNVVPVSGAGGAPGTGGGGAAPACENGTTCGSNDTVPGMMFCGMMDVASGMFLPPECSPEGDCMMYADATCMALAGTMGCVKTCP